MINRRFLRVKVLQGLYTYFQTDNASPAQLEKEVFRSIDRFFDLYLYMLSLLVEIRAFALNDVELRKNKKLPAEEDANPNMKFVNNGVLRGLEQNITFNKIVEAKKISWNLRGDIVKKLFKSITESEEYQHYMRDSVNDFNEDKKLVADLYKKFIMEDELLEHHFEEASIYWPDDIGLVDSNIVKSISQFKKSVDGTEDILLSLYKDEADDREFVKDLFKKVIKNSDGYASLIDSKTKNWEMDRIALLDVILMKMAICEIENFNSIPIKVSLNEYIELSKDFSTPKSKMFINGVLDKLVEQLKKEG